MLNAILRNLLNHQKQKLKPKNRTMKKQQNKTQKQRSKLKNQQGRKVGRPKGSLKKYKFEQTKLGFALKYECPAVFEVITKVLPKYNTIAPSIKHLELIFRNSNDPSLKKPKFKRYLEDFKKHGLYCHRARELTPEKEKYYKKIRAKKHKTLVENKKNTTFVPP